MSTQTSFPSQAELNQIRLQARQMQAEAIGSAVRAVLHWIAHPSLHLRHA